MPEGSVPSGVPIGNAVFGVGAGGAVVVVVVGGAVVVVTGGAVVVVTGGAVVVGACEDVVVVEPVLGDEVGAAVGAVGANVVEVVVATGVAVVVVTVRRRTGRIDVAEFGGRQWFANSISCVRFQPRVCVVVTYETFDDP